MASRCFALLFAVLLSFPGSLWAQNLVQDLPSDRDALQARLDLILDPQTKTIEISTFILDLDRVGLGLLGALTLAAERGVQIRLLVDGKIGQADAAMVTYLQEAGIQIRYHNPSSRAWANLWTNPLRVFDDLNHRMHQKIFVVNRHEAIIGDKNYSEKFFWLSSKEQSLTMSGKEVYVKGEAALGVSKHFETIWNEPDIVEPKRLGSLAQSHRDRIKAQLEPYRNWVLERYQSRLHGIWRKQAFSYEDTRVLEDRPAVLDEAMARGGQHTTLMQILKAIEEAPPKTRILIENSYFVLFPELETALKTALAKGSEIHVVLNTPEAADQKVIAQALRIDLPKMLEMGLQVSLNPRNHRISHAKLVVIGDERVIIGSANVDPRSYRINSEISVEMKSPELGRYYWDKYQKTKALRRQVVKANSCSFIFTESSYEVSGPTGPLPARWLTEWLRPHL